MHSSSPPAVLQKPVSLHNPKTNREVEGLLFTGHGKAIVAAISSATGIPSADVLDAIVNRLLVNKGADWTSVILSEYLELYDDSLGTFSIVWDRTTNQLVSHGSVFQSKQSPVAGLVAHIRTLDAFKTLGLGTVVTEEVTRAALNQGANAVILATDDKLHRVQQGERAAYTMYSKIGYGILAEKTLADTVDWLMIVDKATFALCQDLKAANAGRYVAVNPALIEELQKTLIAKTRSDLASTASNFTIRKVTNGDIANLFLLLNLCPANDFKCKLSAWQVQLGPEFERTFIVSTRPAIVDQDRLQDASQVLVDAHGNLVAICAANQQMPFTRQTMRIDFYCLPDFLKHGKTSMLELVSSTIANILSSEAIPRPCRLVFSGIDLEKIAIFEQLGFSPTSRTESYFGPEGKIAVEIREYERILG